jgi:hypothetical protein
MFTMLGRSCSCTTDETWLAGPSLPLQWSREIEDLVKAELGFDPEHPEALGAIKGVLQGAAASRSFGEAALGYTETLLGVDDEAPPVDPGAEPPPAHAARSEVGAGAADERESGGEPPATRTALEIAAASASGERPTAASAGSASTPAEPDAPPRAEHGALERPAPSRAGHGVLLALSGLALVVLAGATLVVLRRSRSK